MVRRTGCGRERRRLWINGQPAQQVTGNGAGPYTFIFPSPSTGQVQVAWIAGHGIQDLASPPNPFGGGSWSYFLADILIQHVIHISVDGLGAYYLRDYVTNASAQFPISSGSATRRLDA